MIYIQQEPNEGGTWCKGPVQARITLTTKIRPDLIIFSFYSSSLLFRYLSLVCGDMVNLAFIFIPSLVIFKVIFLFEIEV